MPDPDKYHGQGGTFVVNKQGERERAKDADGREIKPGEPHPDGDRARDANGKPFDEQLEAKAPAIPAPAATPPWAGEPAPAPAAPESDSGDSPRSRKRGG